MFNPNYDKLAERILELERDNHLSTREATEVITALAFKDKEEVLIINNISDKNTKCDCNKVGTPSSPINVPIKGFTKEGDPILDRTKMQMVPPVPTSTEIISNMNPFTNG